jgi:membrane protein YdbS with pleckstrin-like domain
MLDQPEKAYQPLSLKDWMLTILISIIPLVNLIMYFVWAFDSGTHPSKKNWAKATLIWVAILIVVYIIFFALFGAMFFSAMEQNIGAGDF